MLCKLSSTGWRLAAGALCNCWGLLLEMTTARPCHTPAPLGAGRQAATPDFKGSRTHCTSSWFWKSCYSPFPSPLQDQQSHSDHSLLTRCADLFHTCSSSLWVCWEVRAHINPYLLTYFHRSWKPLRLVHCHHIWSKAINGTNGRPEKNAFFFPYLSLSLLTLRPFAINPIWIHPENRYKVCTLASVNIGSYSHSLPRFHRACKPLTTRPRWNRNLLPSLQQYKKQSRSWCSVLYIFEIFA